MGSGAVIVYKPKRLPRTPRPSSFRRRSHLRTFAVVAVAFATVGLIAMAKAVLPGGGVIAVAEAHAVR